MGLFSKSVEVKSTQYYAGVVFAIYGKYIIKNWPNHPMQQRLGCYFKGIADCFDWKLSGTQCSNLFLVGCVGKSFTAEWSIEEVVKILSESESDLNLVKKAIQEVYINGGQEEMIPRALDKCVGANIDGKTEQEKEIDSGLVMCVYNTIVERATIKRPRVEANDALQEATTSGLLGGLMLCCHRDLGYPILEACR